MSAVPVERRDDLGAYGASVASCARCRLSQGRTQVVFGSGSPDADLMFVGEAPGFHEDRQGLPFVGQAGKLLEKLLAQIGMARGDVYIANVLKCLSHDTPVQLGDGSWERVGRLVRSGYAGTVMSVDAAGRLVPRRVTGRHESPLAGRRVLTLTYASARSSRSGRVSTRVTGDHRVLTQRGWVPAGELTAGDKIATGQGLSRLARDVVCGSLLGGGSVWVDRGRGSLALRASAGRAEYVRWKAGLLAELEPSCEELALEAAAGGARPYGAILVRTRAHRGLRTLASELPAPAWLADELNERMLAFWFMDGGRLRDSRDRRPLAELPANGLGAGGVALLLRGLARLGLPAKELRGRIFFDAGSTRRLSELIAPFVPPWLRRTLDPAVAASVPFDPSGLRAGPPEVMYDDVAVEDVTDEWRRGDPSFFCLDVDETHNFVTSGGVVHNCRPPGNRDPQPDEIEACEGHLFRQIELIRPAVVATLGNFATKLLSGRPLGITKVHGQEQATTLGGRSVLLYPLYHPAAALYTPAMLQVLESDFARLPELLGRSPQPVAGPPEPSPRLAAATAPVEQLGLF